MEFPPFFPFGGDPELKQAVANLASLEENELSIISEVLSQLDVPINHRKAKASGKRVHEKIGKLSEDEWGNVVALILQLLTIPDLMGLLESVNVIDNKKRTQIQKALDLFRSNECLKRVI